MLERITEVLHESSSMSMLDGGEIVYVARSAASRVLAAGLSVGSGYPHTAHPWDAYYWPLFLMGNSMLTSES